VRQYYPQFIEFWTCGPGKHQVRHSVVHFGREIENFAPSIMRPIPFAFVS
jgi:hypothetical protein